jgi:protein-disulfide isomerase
MFPDDEEEREPTAQPERPDLETESVRPPASPASQGRGVGYAFALVAILAFAGGLIARDWLFPPSRSLELSLEALQAQLEALTALPEEIAKLREGLGQVQDELAALREQQKAQAAKGRPVEAEPTAISADDDPAMGSEDAPVVVIEFSDFQCPFCKRFHETTLPKLIEQYVNTGKVRFVYRDFPLTQIHPNAGLAALAAECADEQNSFWPMHDLLFERQGEWAGSSNAQAVFEGYARELGLDVEQFSECLSSQRYAEEVLKDLRDGVSYGVKGTPAFFINGDKLEGAWPFGKFKDVIDAALARAEADAAGE